MDRCGNYFIEDLDRLGRGGFGEVYEVNVHNLRMTHSRRYARKYFSPSPENDKTAIKEIADLRERFLVEIKTQYTLNIIDYDSIAPIVLFNTAGDKPYFIMEKAEANLLEAIKIGMSAEEKIMAVRQIIKGVKTIHDNSYVHRDLKPANILKYSDGRYKISDFGLVKDLNHVRAEVKTKFQPNGIGTDGYRAPEITESGLFSNQSDIFAIGQVINDVYSKNLPQKLKDVISKCRAHWPENRYADANELLLDFCRAMGVTP
ncbi:serine/threonine protein kinase [Xenorhabdus griffiniae]|uniref:Protein kinase n=1 Tax=Xenorhabdus griffiniae TaxID=351672 RepID=A0ABY9XFC4_9GAMM|nr:protein kinase [Xenorhabdus griffiniae]MBD1229375.1 protein kinase [Xenorhabdus griffiniae]MBE8589117.1 protein kinase [Xenorhabdus griffiniae]WMV71623.1 protein kinase [Xenorhabdus griffiniae]WNH01300.1 protein kinase [Xenorhabdus griffiniae]